jgi:D-beta-D-heptose 7-phosphate kinase/D-beta-D-heptose 1-phosphate adenosyltransferase
MGGLGCEYQGKRYPTNQVEVKDLAGAGDTFIAALVVKFLETDDISQAIKFANQCASKVVTQKGVNSI